MTRKPASLRVTAVAPPGTPREQAGAAIRWWFRPEPVIAAALLAAAAIHALVVSEHYREWALAGAFFLVLEIVELALALAALTWWRPLVARAVILSGFGTIAVWAWSRTLGMPFGPEDFRHPEAVGLPDLLCGVLELVAATCALRAAGSARGLASR